MEPITFYTERIEERGVIQFTDKAKALLKQLHVLPVGMFQFCVKNVKSIRSTRYKYHFGHVLPMIVASLNQHNVNQILDPLTGDLTPIDTDTLHSYHKQIFNPCLIKNFMNMPTALGNIPEYISTPMSTTKLSDGEFINRYEDQIIEFYSTNYGIEFFTREEFAEEMKAGGTSKRIINHQLEREYA